MIFAHIIICPVFIVYMLFGIYVETASNPCVPRTFAFGQVCVCNTSYCDTLDEPLTPYHPYQVVVVTSGTSGSRFAVSHANFVRYHGKPIIFNGTDNVLNATVTVNEQSKFQTIVGFGGAHTGAVTYLLKQLPQSLQDFIYESYYSQTKGIAYTMTRVPIGGCDFDLEPWAYNESPVNDRCLSNFTSLDERDLDRINQIHRLKLVSGQRNIKYVGTAWSSPKWMKSNSEWDGKSRLLPQFYDTWAEYHLRYIQLMKRAGVDFWAITTGNEPLDGNVLKRVVPFMSLGWTSEHQAKWIGDFLGPLISSSDVNYTKILAGDDQRYTFPWWFQEIEAASQWALDYIYGFAVHFYADALTSPKVLDITQNEYPEKVIINTEACLGSSTGDVRGPTLGSWSRAQSYILSVIEDLEHSVSGWIDWNLILDPNGGPNYADNFVDAPIIVNASSGEIYKQPMFYGLGHFSRFIPEGSVRIDVRCSNGIVKTLGFKRPDGCVVLICYNQFILGIDMIVLVGNRKVVITIPAQSIQSIVYRSS